MDRRLARDGRRTRRRDPRGRAGRRRGTWQSGLGERMGPRPRRPRGDEAAIRSRGVPSGDRSARRPAAGRGPLRADTAGDRRARRPRRRPRGGHGDVRGPRSGADRRLARSPRRGPDRRDRRRHRVRSPRRHREGNAGRARRSALGPPPRRRGFARDAARAEDSDAAAGRRRLPARPDGGVRGAPRTPRSRHPRQGPRRGGGGADHPLRTDRADDMVPGERSGRPHRR